MTHQDLISQSTGCIRANAEVAYRIMTGQQTQHRVLAKGKNNPFRVGEIYWIREPGRVLNFSNDGESLGEYLKIEYSSDGCIKTVSPDFSEKWDHYEMGAPNWVINRQGIPNGIFKEAARTFVRIERAWKEPVQDITTPDIYKEGCLHCVEKQQISCDEECGKCPSCNPRKWFTNLFNSIYPGAWDRNEDVWACEFERVEVTE